MARFLDHVEVVWNIDHLWLAVGHRRLWRRLMMTVRLHATERRRRTRYGLWPSGSTRLVPVVRQLRGSHCFQMVHLVNGELVEVEHVLCIELGLCKEQILLDCRPLESGHVATVVRLNGYGCPIAQIVATDLQLLASAFTQENVLLAYGPNGGRG